MRIPWGITVAGFSKAVLTALMALCLASGIGCRRREVVPPPVEPEWVVAVGDARVTAEAFEAEWRFRTQQRREPLARDDVLSAVVDEWTAYEAARASGFLDDPGIQREWRRLAGTRYREQMLERKRAELGGADVGEEAIRAEYAASEDRWVKPEARLIGCFSWSSPMKAPEEKRRETRSMVERWRDSVPAHADPRSRFAELCRMHSEDSGTRYFGGESGWLTQEQWTQRWGAQAGEAIAALKSVGEVTPVVESSGRLFFFQLRGVRERSIRPLGEVAGILRSEKLRLWEQTVAKAVAAELASRVTVRTNDAALERIVPPPASKPAEAAPARMTEF